MAHQTAETKFIETNSTKFAYRRIGQGKTSIPLVILIHFRGTMDQWDPLLINSLAATREVIIFDNSGIGKSSGEVPDNFAGWAQNGIDLVTALGYKKIDLLGFSMGGMVAQLFALKAPNLVRRLILAGTGPSAGPGHEAGPEEYFHTVANAKTAEEQKSAFFKSFFVVGEESSAEAAWKRINERVKDRTDYLGSEGTSRQVASVIKWASGQGEVSYDRLGDIKIPVFVADGDNDVLVPTSQSFILKNRIPNAHLHIYPNAGHGFLYQYATLFAQHINLFLDS